MWWAAGVILLLVLVVFLSIRRGEQEFAKRLTHTLIAWIALRNTT
jgi:hypothetical protein